MPGVNEDVALPLTVLHELVLVTKIHFVVGSFFWLNDVALGTLSSGIAYSIALHGQEVNKVILDIVVVEH